LTVCDHGRWTEQDQDLVLWQGLVLVVLKLKVSRHSNYSVLLMCIFWALLRVTVAYQRNVWKFL